MNAAPIHVNDQNFEKTVLESPVPVLVDFWAPWCVPCHAVAPTLEKLVEEHDGRLRVAKVNVDSDTQWAIHYGVRGIPTLIMIRGGQEVDRVVGVLPYDSLKKKVDAFLAVPTSG